MTHCNCDIEVFFFYTSPFPFPVATFSASSTFVTFCRRRPAPPGFPAALTSFAVEDAAKWLWPFGIQRSRCNFLPFPPHVGNHTVLFIFIDILIFFPLAEKWSEEACMLKKNNKKTRNPKFVNVYRTLSIDTRKLSPPPHAHTHTQIKRQWIKCTYYANTLHLNCNHKRQILPRGAVTDVRLWLEMSVALCPPPVPPKLSPWLFPSSFFWGGIFVILMLGRQLFPRYCLNEQCWFSKGPFFSFLLGLMICGDDDVIGGNLGG